MLSELFCVTMNVSLNLVVRMMGKKLSEMTLEELWKLFPIYLTEHQILSCQNLWNSKF